MDWYYHNWLELLRALGPLIIGIVVAYIAYQQWKVNQTALREKLFDRRFAVFEAVRDALAESDNQKLLGGEEAKPVLANLVLAQSAAVFLFEEDVQSEIKGIRANIQELKTLHKSEKQGAETEATRLAKIKALEERCCAKREDLGKIFSKSLDFKKL